MSERRYQTYLLQAPNSLSAELLAQVSSITPIIVLGEAFRGRSVRSRDLFAFSRRYPRTFSTEASTSWYEIATNTKYAGTGSTGPTSRARGKVGGNPGLENLGNPWTSLTERAVSHSSRTLQKPRLCCSYNVLSKKSSLFFEKVYIFSSPLASIGLFEPCRTLSG